MHPLSAFCFLWCAPSLCARVPPTLRSSCYESPLVVAVICARQMFGFNTVYTHYESQPALLTKSCSLKA